MPAAKSAALLPDTQLQPQQQRIAETGLTPSTRLLIYHALGSGKTLSALAAAEKHGEPYTVVTPASLRPNMRKEQEKFTDQTLPNELMSYTSLAKSPTVPATDTVIFDEAHRLRSPQALQTRQAQQLAQNASHLYLLSGSPIVNSPHDLVPLIRMLTQKKLSTEEFDQDFIGQKTVQPPWGSRIRIPVKIPVLKNKEKLRALLAGHVDYHAPDKLDVARKDTRHVVPMSDAQAKIYKAFWKKLPRLLQQKLSTQFPLSQKELSDLRHFMAGPRQVSLSTNTFQAEKDPLKAFDDSTKLREAFKQRQAMGDQPAVVASNFIDAGLVPYSAALTRAGLPHAMIHGGLSDVLRKQHVDDYNEGRIKTLLLGPAGSEGLSLKGTRLMQLLDPHWNEARGHQTAGRGIRYDSHTDLPLEDRNVQVQRFVSRLPAEGWFGEETPAADEHLEHMAEQKEQLNRQFLKLLQEIGTKKASMMHIPETLEEASEILARTKAASAISQMGIQTRLPVHERREFSPEEQQRVEKGESRWLPRIYQSLGTPASEMLSSPGKGAVLGGLGGAALGGLGGAALAAPLLQANQPVAAALPLGGAAIGGLLGALHTYFSRQAKNEGTKEIMQRLPAGATKRDLESDPVYAEQSRVMPSSGGQVSPELIRLLASQQGNFEDKSAGVPFVTRPDLDEGSKQEHDRAALDEYNELMRSVRRRPKMQAEPLAKEAAGFDIGKTLSDNPLLAGAGLGAGMGGLLWATRGKKKTNVMNPLMTGAALGALGGGLYQHGPKLWQDMVGKGQDIPDATVNAASQAAEQATRKRMTNTMAGPVAQGLHEFTGVDIQDPSKAFDNVHIPTGKNVENGLGHLGSAMFGTPAAWLGHTIHGTTEGLAALSRQKARLATDEASKYLNQASLPASARAADAQTLRNQIVGGGSAGMRQRFVPTTDAARRTLSAASNAGRATAKLRAGTGLGPLYSGVGMRGALSHLAANLLVNQVNAQGGAPIADTVYNNVHAPIGRMLGIQ